MTKSWLELSPIYEVSPKTVSFGETHSNYSPNSEMHYNYKLEKFIETFYRKWGAHLSASLNNVQMQHFLFANTDLS